MTIHGHLLNVNGIWRACITARKWASQYKTAQEVWDNCDNADWLFWWASRMGQQEECAKAAREITDSVKHLKYFYVTDTTASYIDTAAYTAYNAAFLAFAAAYDATHDDATAYDAKLKQKALNLSIVRKHLVCPWHETETELT